jgi:DsbC/DsbD-like thiol-disulfide interchange protein
MNRRQLIISALASCFATPTFAEVQPWSAQLLQGGFDGTQWWAGLAITLQPRWKTYWRVPGDGGISPQIEAVGENLKGQAVHFPLPHRFESVAGTTIGYKEFVVFPLALIPKDANQRMAINLKSFLGVCDEVCIPAQFATELTFDPAHVNAPDQALISQWQGLVPAVVKPGPVVSATAEMREGKPALLLTLSKPVRDVFVEGKALHYFGKPVFEQGTAILPVYGAKTVGELKDGELRITVADGAKGLEQSVTVR